MGFSKTIKPASALGNQTHVERFNRRQLMLSALTVIAVGCVMSGNAFAQCTPDPSNSKQVTCTNTDTDGFTDGSDDVTVTISNTATVEGQITLDDRNTINNDGTIADIFVDNDNTITNTGTITDLIFIGSRNIINNNGIIRVTDTEAISLNAEKSETANNLNNNGVISSTGEHVAVQLIGSGSVVTGSGSISTEGTGAHAIMVGEGSTVTLQSGAMITTGGVGAFGIVNRDNGIPIVNTVNINDGASITTTGDMASGIVNADDASLTVDGSVSTSGESASGVDIDDDSSVIVGATGSISVTGNSASALQVGRRSTVTNAGMISASGAKGAGIFFDEGRATLTNTGTISSMRAFGVLIDKDSPTTSSLITNQMGGTISGASGSIASVGITDTDATVEVVINEGMLIGDVTLGAGDDTFTLRLGGTVTAGGIDLGAGDDTFTFDGGEIFNISGLIHGRSGTDTLVYQSIASDIDKSAVFGFETLIQRSGRLTVTGDLVFDQALIKGGTLALTQQGRLLPNDFKNPAARIDIAIDAAGTLAGQGEIVGNVVNNGMINVDAGGTVQISGDLTLASGSFVDVNITDKNVTAINVDGVTTLNGGTVRFSGVVLKDRTVTVVQSAGKIVDNQGLSSIFDNVMPFTKVSDIMVRANSVVIQVDQTLRDSTLSETGAAVGEFLVGQLGSANGEFLSALMNISDAIGDDGLETALTGLSPELYASAPFAASIKQSRSLLNGLTYIVRSKNRSDDDVRLWATVTGGKAQFDGDEGASDVDISVTQGVVGADYPIADRVRVGLISAYGRSEVEFDALVGGYSGNHYSFGGYTVLNAGDFSGVGLISYTSLDFDGTRTLTNGLVSDSVPSSSSFDTSTLTFHVGGVWHAPIETLGVSAEASFDYLLINRDGFTETDGGPLVLIVDGEDIDVLLGSTGITVGKSVKAGGLLITPEASIRYVHNFSNTDYQATARFVGGNGDSLTIGSAILPDDFAEISLRLAAEDAAWRFSAKIDFGLGEDFTSLGGGLSIQYRF